MVTDTDNTTRWVAFALLLGAVSLVLLPFLGVTPFYTKGEPREAVVALSMLKTGNWILPLSNGDVIPYKPPFLAWCIATVSLIPGYVTEYASRLPSAVALIVLVMSTFLFFTRRVGLGSALVTAVVLLTSFEVYRAGMACRVDMLLTMFIVTAIYRLYIWAMERSCKGLPWGAILLMSGGALTKGPVGIILPLLVVWITVLFCGNRLWRCTWRMAVSAVAAMLIPALWYVAAYQRGGEPFLQLVIEENFGRMTGTMSYDSHVNPWWYNLVTLVGGMAPYTLLVLMALFSLLVPKIRSEAAESIRRWRTVDPVRFFMWIAPLVVLIFYCIPSSKRSVYLLPMYPFMALQVALLALWLARRGTGVVRSFTGFMSIVTLLAAVLWTLMHIPSVVERYTPDLSIKMMQNIAGFIAPTPTWTWIIVCASVVVAIWVFVRQFRDSGSSTVVAMCVNMLMLYIVFGGVYQPAAVTPKSDQPMACDIEVIQPQGRIYSYVAVPMLRFFTADFYLDDRIEPFDYQSSPVSGLILMGDGDATAFKEWYDGRLELSPVKSWGHRSCDIRQSVTLYKFKRTD